VCNEYRGCERLAFSHRNLVVYGLLKPYRRDGHGKEYVPQADFDKQEERKAETAYLVPIVSRRAPYNDEVASAYQMQTYCGQTARCE